MSQNTSHAVMNQRHEAHDSLDDFPTPPWATRALMEHVLSIRQARGSVCWEPACNRGYMAKPLREYFGQVDCSDVHDYGWNGQDTVADFLETRPSGGIGRYDWIITNPPFRLAAQFALHALETWRTSLAILVRTNFLEGKERHATLFARHPPSVVAQFVERVPMVKGRHDPDASTATSYAWIVWNVPNITIGTRFVWIPPCRRQLQRANDA